MILQTLIGIHPKDTLYSLSLFYGHASLSPAPGWSTSERLTLRALPWYTPEPLTLATLMVYGRTPDFTDPYWYTSEKQTLQTLIGLRPNT